MQNSHDAFVIELNAAYETEQVSLEGQREMLEQATAQDLRDALEAHIGSTEKHLQRLDGVFEAQGIENTGGCATARTLLDEARDLISQAENPQAVDAAIIHAVIKTECLEMAVYDVLVNMASIMGLTDAEQAFTQNRESDQGAYTIAIRNSPNLVQAAQ